MEPLLICLGRLDIIHKLVFKMPKQQYQVLKIRLDQVGKYIIPYTYATCYYI